MIYYIPVLWQPDRMSLTAAQFRFPAGSGFSGCSENVCCFGGWLFSFGEPANKKSDSTLKLLHFYPKS